MMKNRFTFEQHWEMAQMLTALREELDARVAAIADAYPKTSPAARKAQETLKALDATREALDLEAFKENPHEVTSVYNATKGSPRYRVFVEVDGKPQDRRAVTMNALLADAWFAHLNWLMQRRVLKVIDSDEEMAHVLEWFPLPFRKNHQWMFPLKGEVTDQWTPRQLAAIRAYVATNPVLKNERGGRLPWTDLTLEEHFAAKAARRASA